MAGEKDAGSIVYTVSADIAPLLQAGRQAIESLDGMGDGAGKAQTHAQTVRNGRDGRILEGKGLRTSENDAVHDDQGDIHAQRVAQGRPPITFPGLKNLLINLASRSQGLRMTRAMQPKSWSGLVTK